MVMIERKSKMPEISVLITTYNQEKYIAQAIESVLKQIDCPDFEIIIGNDCSSDDTLKICEEYREKYPDLITIYSYESNKGMLGNLRFCFSKCKGRYIAICEGDDYWIGPHKLKKQYEKLSGDTDSLFCFTDIKLKYEKSGKLKRHIPEIKNLLGEKFTIKQQIELGGPVGNFSCCMIKKEALGYIPDSYYEHKGNADWLFFLYLLDVADGIFIKDICSVYRIHKNGTWSGLSGKELLLANLEVCLYYNKLFSSKYIDSFISYFQTLFGCSNNQDGKKPLFSFSFPVSKKKKLLFELARLKKR